MPERDQPCQQTMRLSKESEPWVGITQRLVLRRTLVACYNKPCLMGSNFYPQKQDNPIQIRRPV